MSDLPVPRRELGEAGRAFWDATVERFELDHVELELLVQAAGVLDDIEVLADDGSVSGVREVRQLRLAFARLLDKIGLPFDEEKHQTPAQKRASKAARSRWDAKRRENDDEA